MLLGSQLAHYRIVDRVGSGAMGEVYRAEDTRLCREVALKTLPAKFAADPERIQRFRREARALAALEHPGIVTVYSVEKADNVHFLTMELVRGRTLADALPPGGFGPERLVELGVAIAEAMAAAHEGGVVHRDLKPGNLMVTDDGRVKILDFGLARLTVAEDGETDASRAPTQIAATQAGTSLGTPAYMAPEQVRGEPADPRSDLFSLAVVLYELGTGRLPFAGDNRAALAAAILRDTPRPLERVGGDPAPPGLEAIVGRCLAKRRRDRFQSARDLAFALGQLTPGDSADPISVGREATGRSESGTRGAEPSLAVLPFANLSADPEQEYFCDGMAEEVINALAQVAGLKVVARTSAFAFKGRNDDVREIGRRLDVGHVLEGSVRKARQRVRVTAQLIDVADGYHLWSERFDRDLEDVFAIQDEIAAAIVDRLRTTLARQAAGSTLEPPAPRPRPESLAAYELYLKGLHHWHRLTADGYTRSAEYFQSAIEVDPSSARARFGLALWYVSQAFWADRPAADSYREGELHARRALELDPRLSEAHTAMANCEGFGRWDLAAGERSFRRALELGPGVAFNQLNWGAFCLIVGRHDEAADACFRALELDPLAPTTAAWAASFLFWAGRRREGAAAVEEIARLHPGFWQAQMYLGVVLFERGELDAAETALERAVEVSGGATAALTHQALGYFRRGSIERGERVRRKLRRRAAERHVPPAFFAAMAQLRGERHELSKALAAATAERDPWLLFHHFLTTGSEPDPEVDRVLETIGVGRPPA